MHAINNSLICLLSITTIVLLFSIHMPSVTGLQCYKFPSKEEKAQIGLKSNFNANKQNYGIECDGEHCISVSASDNHALFKALCDGKQQCKNELFQGDNPCAKVKRGDKVTASIMCCCKGDFCNNDEIINYGTEKEFTVPKNPPPATVKTTTETVHDDSDHDNSDKEDKRDDIDNSDKKDKLDDTTPKKEEKSDNSARECYLFPIDMNDEVAKTAMNLQQLEADKSGKSPEESAKEMADPNKFKTNKSKYKGRCKEGQFCAQVAPFSNDQSLVLSCMDPSACEAAGGQGECSKVEGRPVITCCCKEDDLCDGSSIDYDTTKMNSRKALSPKADQSSMPQSSPLIVVALLATLTAQQLARFAMLDRHDVAAA